MSGYDDWEGPVGNLDLYTMRGQRSQQISALYAADFRVDDQQLQATTSVTHVSSTGASASPVVVQVASELIKDEATYKTRLHEWSNEVTDYENKEIEAFLKGHCEMVVDSMDDPKKLIKKLDKIPVMHEPKRKAFTQDVGNQQPTDWVKLKKRRLSMFQPIHHTVEPDHLNCLIEVYSHFRSENDKKESDDNVVVIVPGGPPSLPFNKNTEVAARAAKDVSKIRNTKQM